MTSVGAVRKMMRFCWEPKARPVGPEVKSVKLSALPPKPLKTRAEPAAVVSTWTTELPAAEVRLELRWYSETKESALAVRRRRPPRSSMPV